MIGHETPGKNPRSIPLAAFAEDLQVYATIPIVEKHVALKVSPLGDPRLGNYNYIDAAASTFSVDFSLQ